MPLQHINNTNHEKQKYIHHEAPIYTEMYIQMKQGLFRQSLKHVMQLIGRVKGKIMFQNKIF